jgi:hypothetical protein
MSKNRRKIDTHHPNNRVSGRSAGVQRNLFEYIRQERTRVDRSSNHQEGTLGIGETLRLALNEAIKKSPLSRHQIAGEMSHLLGCEVTKTTMDTWTAESKTANRIPAEYLPAFCQTTKSRRPLEILNEAAGLFSMPGPDALRSEIQKYDEMERKARAEKLKRKRFLQELEQTHLL